MTDPKFASNVPGKGRWYTHPVTGEQWPSVTNVLDVAVSKPALVGWAAKITELKAWDVLPRMVALSRSSSDCKAPRVDQRCGKCRTCLTREIRAEVRVAKESAADLGTRVHALAEAHMLDKPVWDDDEAQPFVDQALRFYREWGITLADVEAAEMTIVNRTIGYAGTLDLLVWLDLGHGRKLTVVDYKSSLTRPVDSVYPENGMQVAALAHGETALMDDGTEVDMPGPIEQAVIVNLRTDDYAVMPMPVAGTLDDAYQAFVGALADATYLHSCYSAKPQPLNPPTKTRTRKAA